MSEILSFEEAVNKKIAKKISNELGGFYKNASSNIDEFSQLALKDPDQAIDQIPTFIENARNSAGPGTKVWEAYAGGANEEWTAPILDIIGTIYPTLSKPAREKALRNSLSFLDGQNYFVAQNNVEKINEPWLVGDIIFNRGLYWSGYKNYCDLLEKHQEWGEVYEKLESIESAFWMSLAVIRKGYSSNQVRENFYTFFPTLTDRTLDTIAGWAIVSAQYNLIVNKIPLKETIEEGLEKYDPDILPDIRRKITEQKWVDLDAPIYDPKDTDHEPKYRSKLDIVYSPKPSSFLKLVK